MTRCLPFLLLAAALVGCSSADKTDGPHFDVRAPMRLAVLPFTDESKGDAVLSKPFTAVLDNLPLSDDEMKSPATMIRNRVVAHLQRTSLDVLNAQAIDQAIMAGDMYTVARLMAIDTRTLGRGLGADLLMYGRLVEWDRDFYGVQSSITVRVALKVIDVESGKIVYEAEREEVKSRGILGGPTGLTSAITAPIFGLSKAAFLELSNEVARAVVTPLIPEAEGTAPTVAAPYISAATHAVDGEKLTVYMVGTPGARARFRIGAYGAEVPMTEFGAGRYRGSCMLQPGEAAEESPIAVTLNVRGRRTRAVMLRGDG